MTTTTASGTTTTRFPYPGRKARLAVIILTALLGCSTILWSFGVLQLTSYQGTYGVNLNLGSHYYCSADVTLGTDFQESTGCQHTGY